MEEKAKKGSFSKNSAARVCHTIILNVPRAISAAAPRKFIQLSEFAQPRNRQQQSSDVTICVTIYIQNKNEKHHQDLLP